MAPTLKQGLTVAVAVGAAVIGGTAMAGATGDRGETRSGADSARTGGPGPYGFGPRRDGGHRHRGRPSGPGRPGRGGPQALTGATAEKVKSAALARVKGGTVLFSHADRDGGYEAHVRKADGTMVEVRVNRSFRVTPVEAHEHRGPGRRP
jgi:hypothetical protein